MRWTSLLGGIALLTLGSNSQAQDFGRININHDDIIYVDSNCSGEVDIGDTVVKQREDRRSMIHAKITSVNKTVYEGEGMIKYTLFIDQGFQGVGALSIYRWQTDGKELEIQDTTKFANHVRGNSLSPYGDKLYTECLDYTTIPGQLLK